MQTAGREAGPQCRGWKLEVQQTAEGLCIVEGHQV